MSEIHETNWIYPNLTMEISHNFPGVDVDFWTMHKVILKHFISSLYIQCFLIKYNIIMFTSSYFYDSAYNYLELRKGYLH
jgi:hypothetical protein